MPFSNPLVVAQNKPVLERRTQTRHDLKVPACFELGDEKVWGEIHNINMEGAFVKSETVLPPFIVLKNLRFELPDGGPVLVRNALVVWNHDGSQGDLYPRGMGLYFQDIDPSQRAAIRDFIRQISIY